MGIIDLPKKKNITKFTDKELLLWLKDYIEGWAKEGVPPPKHYEVVKTEIIRRNSERMLNLTKKIHILTVALVFLTVVLVVFTVVLVVVTFVSIFAPK